MTKIEVIKTKEKIEQSSVIINEVFYDLIKQNFDTLKNLIKIVQIDKANLDKAQIELLNEMMSWKKNKNNN